MHVDEFQVQSDKLDCNGYEFMVQKYLCSSLEERNNEDWIR